MTRRQRLTFLVAVLASALVALNQSIVNVALPGIADPAGRPAD